MATHSCILAEKIPWTEEPVRYKLWDHKEPDMTEQLSIHIHTHTQTHTHIDTHIHFI